MQRERPKHLEVDGMVSLSHVNVTHAYPCHEGLAWIGHMNNKNNKRRSSKLLQ